MTNGREEKRKQKGERKEIRGDSRRKGIVRGKGKEREKTGRKCGK